MPYYTYSVPVHEICVQIVERIMPVRVCVSIMGRMHRPKNGADLLSFFNPVYALAELKEL